MYLIINDKIKRRLYNPLLVSIKMLVIFILVSIPFYQLVHYLYLLINITFIKLDFRVYTNIYRCPWF